ncbi:MAG: hypothetical protein GXO89_13710 [Chlorobi bacterium]|nr:hypothetical protein [Chlorobiota bacterium]
MELKKLKSEDISKLGLFEVLHILSLDVALGGLGGGILASKVLNVEPGFAFWIILPVAVWALYNFDHLIDGTRLKENAHTIRHFYHYHYSKRILTIMGFLLLLMVPVIFVFLEKPIVLFGAIAGTITVAYFLVVYFFGNRKSFFVQKELSVALIYTFGIWGGPASLMSWNFNSGQIILVIAFFICALTAVILFSYCEEDTDRADHHTTLVARFGKLWVKRILYFLFPLLFALSIYEVISANQIIYARTAKLYMLMGILLLMIMSFSETLKQNNRYRYLTEFVFWLPGLAFWL